MRRQRCFLLFLTSFAVFVTSSFGYQLLAPLCLARPSNTTLAVGDSELVYRNDTFPTRCTVRRSVSVCCNCVVANVHEPCPAATPLEWPTPSVRLSNLRGYVDAYMQLAANGSKVYEFCCDQRWFLSQVPSTLQFDWTDGMGKELLRTIAKEDYDEIRPDFVNTEQTHDASSTTARPTTTTTAPSTVVRRPVVVPPKKDGGQIGIGALSRDVQTKVKLEEFHQLPCEDHYALETCQLYVNFYSCTNRVVRRVCPHMCRLCTRDDENDAGALITSFSIDDDRMCVDNWNQCARHVDECATDSRVRIMCPKTCQICKNTITCTEDVGCSQYTHLSMAECGVWLTLRCPIACKHMACIEGEAKTEKLRENRFVARKPASLDLGPSVSSFFSPPKKTTTSTTATTSTPSTTTPSTTTTTAARTIAPSPSSRRVDAPIRFSTFVSNPTGPRQPSSAPPNCLVSGKPRNRCPISTLFPENNLRYYFDERHFTCLLFEDRRCPEDANFANIYATYGECTRSCIPADGAVCSGNRRPFVEAGTIDEVRLCARHDGRLDRVRACPITHVCTNNAFNAYCCPRQSQESYRRAFRPTCANSRPVVAIDIGGIQIARLGLTCNDRFCPAGTACVQGDVFAHCC